FSPEHAPGMRHPGILACSAKWLLMGLAPAVLVGGAAADGDSTIVVGNARFEFLTSSLVRLEYSASGTFVDAPTAVVQKRQWPNVAVRSTQKDGWLTATSGALSVRYRLQSGAFSA